VNAALRRFECFEHGIDCLAMKISRFAFSKFPQADPMAMANPKI
jgi:carbamoylphosphate synthase large subunit